MVRSGIGLNGKCHGAIDRHKSVSEPGEYHTVKGPMNGMRVSLRHLACALVLTVLIGCGGDHPQLGFVSGRVLHDGKPVEGVIVTFKPEEGRPAVGVTDENGKYQLEYSYQLKGTKVGPNKVGLSWPIGVTGSIEIPARYSGKTELSCEVEAGCNTFDIDLESDEQASKKKSPTRAGE